MAIRPVAVGKLPSARRGPNVQVNVALRDEGGPGPEASLSATKAEDLGNAMTNSASSPNAISCSSYVLSTICKWGISGKIGNGSEVP
jgi:hypothetical protein